MRPVLASESWVEVMCVISNQSISLLVEDLQHSFACVAATRNVPDGAFISLSTSEKLWSRAPSPPSPAPPSVPAGHIM